MGQLGGGALAGLSRQLGTDTKQTQAGIAAALPMLLGALSRNSESGAGASALSAALDRDHDGGILNDPAGFLGQGDTAPGAGILKHLFADKQTRVANGLSQATGMDGAAAGKLLALLAPMVLGALGRAKRQGNLDPAQLSSYLGKERQAVEKAAPQQLGALNRMLDADGDGDVDLSDLLKQGSLLGKLFGR